jgi:hypothetical protein
MEVAVKSTFVLFIFLLFPLYILSFSVSQIPLTDIESIAMQNAKAQWGDVYPDNPIPYYDRDGKLIAWQFNFCLGKPFPDRDELQELCRANDQKLWDCTWNTKEYANMILGARSDKPVIISYAKGLSYDYSYLTVMEKLAGKALNKPYKLDKMVHVNTGSRWFVVSDANKELYIKAFAPSKVLSYQDFYAATDSLETPLVPIDFSSQWDEYLNGRIDPQNNEYIPYHEKMPFYQWVVGCSPCSGSMLAAWWDNNSDVTSADYANLIKYHFQAYDDVQEHIDYHISDAVSSIGYYMGTDDEGGTHYYNIDDGMQDFFNSRNYGCWVDSDDLEWEFLWDYDDLFYAARGQIRQGKPTLLAIPGHSITGMGYSTTSHFLAVHDPNYPDIQNLYQSEFNMVTYIHPSGAWGSACQLITPDGGQGWSTNGTGETWYASGIHEIKWAGDFSGDTYAKIYYHLDRGLANPGWTVIVANTPNDGSYDWMVPSGIASDSCRIKIEIYNSSNQLVGADGSYGNFRIVSGGANPALQSGIPLAQSRNPIYYTIPDNENSWVVVATQKSSSSTGMGMKLYQNISLTSLLASSENNNGFNLMAWDRNHLPNNEYALKVYNTNGVVGGKTEFEGGDNQLYGGTSNVLTWGSSQIVKMWDVELSPGTYVVSLDMISGNHDLGMALFSSSGANYIRTLNQAMLNIDSNPGGQDESFIISITSADRYGLCVYCNDNLILSNPSSFTITIGTPGYWTGAYNQIWATAANWANGQVPGNTSDVYIPASAANQPRIFGGMVGNCRSLTIQDGAVLEVANGTLNVRGGYTDVYGTLYVSQSSSVVNLNGHVLWHPSAVFQEANSGTIYVGGNWIENSGCLVQIATTNVVMNGAESSVIITNEVSNYFGNLQIAKDSGQQVSYSIDSEHNLVIKGNLTINSGSTFYGWSDKKIYLWGNLVSNGSLQLEFSDFYCSCPTSQTISCNASDCFSDLFITSNTTVTLLTNITVKANLSVAAGTLNAQYKTTSVEGNVFCDIVYGHITGTGNRIKMTGSYNATCEGVEYDILEIAKYGSGEVQINSGYSVQCNSLDWTSGVVRVAGGSLWAEDLADTRIMGAYILTDGQIDLFQDINHYVDLDADLDISGGVFNIHGGYNFPSEWAYTQSCQVIISGGVLDFMDNGIYLRSTGHYLNATITGGTIRTSKDFKVERNGFNPVGGTVELYGSGSAVLHVNSPSNLWILKIDKNSRENVLGSREERVNQVTVDSDTSVTNYCNVLSGILQISSCRLTVGGYMSIYGALRMDDQTDILDVVGGFSWESGSSAVNLTGGLMIHHNNVFLDEGCNVQLSPAVVTLFSGGHTVCVTEPASALGTVIMDTSSGQCYFYGDNPMNINGDLIIKPNATLIMTSASQVNVGGKIDIWNQGTMLMSGLFTCSTTNLYNSGLLIFEHSCIGDFTVANTFLQYTNGSLALHAGNLIINTAYNGSLYAFAGTTNMSGGSLQISNNGMQIGTSGFTFSGGTIKLGWGFQANNPSTFMASSGTLEMLGTLSATISLGSGNYLPNLIVNKTGTSGAVYLQTDTRVKQNCTVLSGKLYVNHHKLTVDKSIYLSSNGYLYDNNADDEVWLGSNWTNSGTAGNFIEGSGLVVFSESSYSKSIATNESFFNLRIACGTGTVSVTANKAITVGGNLEITSGRFKPLDGTSLNVLGNCTITGEGSYLDQNFTRSTAPTNVHIGGNLIVNQGKVCSIDVNGDNPNDVYEVDGGLEMTAGVIDMLGVDFTLSGDLTTTTATEISMRGGNFTNTASGTWQLFNCHWVTYGNIIEFPNKGLQFTTGAILDNNSSSVIRTGKNLYAVTNGVLSPSYGTFEFTGSTQANINMGGNNKLPSIKVNKTTAAVVLSTSAVITGDLTISSGTFNSNGNTLEIQRDWNNQVGSSGYTCGTSEIIFKKAEGYSSQNIYGNQTFYKLTFNHPTNADYTTAADASFTVLNDINVLAGGLYLGNASLNQVNGNVNISSGAFLRLTNGELAIKGNLVDNNTFTCDTDLLTAGLLATSSSKIQLNGSSNQSIIVAYSTISVGGIKVNKSAGSFLPSKPMLITGNATIQAGTWGYGTSGLTHVFEKDLAIDSGGVFSDNTGTLHFTGTQTATISNAGVASFKNIWIDKTPSRVSGPNVNLNSNITINTSGTVVVDGGILNLAVYTMQTNGNVDINSDGKLLVGTGGVLKMLSGSAVNVNSGGTLALIGSTINPATISSVSGYYGLVINSGATLSAGNAVFERMNADGVYIQNGAFVDATNSLNNCTFRYGQAGGTLLKINNNQMLTINNASFPTNAGSNAKNITKSMNQGTVAFVGETGVFAGTVFESDPFFRINWSSDVPQIQLSQASFSFGEVVWSHSSFSQFLVISNPGSAMLTGTITTPPCFSISPWGRQDSNGFVDMSSTKAPENSLRNVLEYSVAYGGSNTFELIFQPAEPIPYSGDMLITHNAAGSSILVPLSGEGVGARLTYDNTFFNIDLSPDGNAARLLNIGNSGADSLSYFAYVSYQTRDQIIVTSTGFEDSFPPSGWTETEVNYVSGTHGDWSQLSLTQHPYGIAPHEGSWLASFNSYTAASNNQVRLESPVVDLHSINNASLSFWMYHDSVYPSYADRIQVQASIDGGAWVNVGSPIYRYNGQNEWDLHAVSLWDYQGQSNVRIGLLGISAYGNDLNIDDVLVMGNYQLPTDWITLNGSDICSGYIFPDEPDVPINISVNTEGIPEGWYMNTLYIMCNDPVNSMKAIPLNVRIGTPAYTTNPTSLNFGMVVAGNTTTQDFDITNTGAIGLTGTVSAPEGYSIELITAPRAAENAVLLSEKSAATRNTAEFYLYPGIVATFTVSFSPTAAQSYDNQLTISTNTGTDGYLPLFGQGITPPVVTTGAASEITHNSAICGGTVVTTGNLTLSQRGIVWNTYGNPTVEEDNVILSTGQESEFSIPMTNLIHNTTYYVKAFAQNTIGRDYGEEIQFTTLCPWLLTEPTVVPDFGNIPVGETSGPHSFTISGGNLVDMVMISGFDGFTLSLSPDSDYTTMLNIYPTRSDLPETTVYVKFTPQDTGFWTYNLVPLTVGGNNCDVTVSGSGVTSPAVETATIVDITTNSAAINARILDDGFAPITACGVCYSTSAEPEITDPHTDEGAQADWFTSSISGLNSNTTYYVRAYAQNVAGLVYGGEVSFCTLSEPQITIIDSLLNPFGKVIIGEVSPIDTLLVSAVQLSGNLVITAPEGFELSLTPSGRESRDYSTQITLSPVTGNIPLTSLYIRFAPNIGGNLSNYLSFDSQNIEGIRTMLNGIGITTPTLSTNPATDVTYNSATTGATIISDGWDSILACGVCWSTTPNPDLDSNHTTNAEREGQFEEHLTDLQPNSTYYVRAYATNTVGTTYGNQEVFETLGIPYIDAPLNVRISVMEGIISLSWDAVLNAASYHIYRSIDPNAIGWGTAIGSVNTPGFTDPGATDSGMYFYKVTADTNP